MSEAEMLKRVNELGHRISEMFDGQPPLVVMNVAALMLAGACKSADYTSDQAHECLALTWEGGAGLEATTVRLT
jgi:hypothetical protein